eukprot:Hpha_TRINITY_DN17138_c0_g1::TRINITY_DN17138_c0_g1_i1::g.146864::m.146864
MPAPCITRLGNDVILAVVQYLPLPSRLRFGSMNRRVYAVVHKWPPISLDLAGTHEQLAVGCLRWAIQNVGPGLVALNLHGFQLEIDELLDEVLSRCTKLEVLSLAHCTKATDRSLHSIRRYISGSIRELCLWSAGTDDKDHKSCLTGDALAELLTECRNLEAVDLRSQQDITDEHMALMADLPRMAKFSLAGTTASAESFEKLLSTRSDTIIRAGAMQLGRGNGSNATIPPCPKLRELQISYSPVRMEVNLRDLPSLRFIGVTQTVHSINWMDLEGSKVQQICTDPHTEGPVFWRGLQAVASQLVHLSLISYTHPQHGESMPDFIPALKAMVSLEQLNLCPCIPSHLAAASKLPSLRCIHLYLVSRPAWCPLLAHADPLPIGTLVRVGGNQGRNGIVTKTEVREGADTKYTVAIDVGMELRQWVGGRSALQFSGVDRWEVDDETDVGFFPALEELSLVESEIDPEMLAATFRAGVFPRLKALHIARSMGRISFPPSGHHPLLGEDRFPMLRQVVDILSSIPRTSVEVDGEVIEKSQLEELSLPILAANPRGDQPDPSLGLPEGPRAKVEDVAKVLSQFAPNLRSLHLPTSLCTSEAAKVVCGGLPLLKVLGPRLGSHRFEEEGFRGVRMKVEGPGGRSRWLNRNNPHGYAEGSAVKPDCSFMRFMEFAIDPVYSYTRLDDNDEPWPVTDPTAAGADNEGMDEDVCPHCTPH